MQNNKPVRKFRATGSITGALWENEIAVNGKQITVLKASVERRYKDASGVWKSSTSFGRNEIPLAIYCLQKAFEAIIEDGNARDENSIDEETIG